MKKILGLSIIATSALLAQPTITDIEKSISIPKEVQKKESQLIEIGKDKYAPVMSDDKTGRTIEVKDFEIEGNTQLGEDELKKLLSEYMGKSLTFSQLQEATSLLTKYYRQKSFFVARAYIPKQDLNASNGVVKIAIIEGNYGEFKLTNNSKVKDSIVQAMFDDAKNRGNVVSTHTLERSMLIINDTPGVVVTRADVRPGHEIGTSDFIVATEASPWYDGYIIADNYGSKYTSAYRTMAGVNFNNPFDLGDKISLSGLYGANGNLDNYRLAYSFPIMPNGLRGEFSYANTNYDLEKKYVTNQDIQGDSKTFEATLSYPIIRTRTENLYTNLTFASKKLYDENGGAQTNEKSVTSLNLGLNYIKSTVIGEFDTQYTMSTNFVVGRLNMKDPVAKAIDDAGAKTDGSYQKVVLNLTNTTLFSPTMSLETSFLYQQSLGGKNLDGSEDLSIGGSNGIKVYPDSEESGENGYILKTEFFYTLPVYKDINHKASLFAETARVRQENNIAAVRSSQLSDVGIGYNISYKDFFAKAYYARLVGGSEVTSEADGKKYKNKFLMQAGWVF